MTTTATQFPALVDRLATEWEWSYRETLRMVCTRSTLEISAQLLGLHIDVESNAGDGVKDISRKTMRELAAFIRETGYPVPRMTDGSRGAGRE